MALQHHKKQDPTEIRGAALLFGLPYSTFRRAVQNKREITKERRGRKPVLSEAEEKVIHETVVRFARNGTPLF